MSVVGGNAAVDVAALVCPPNHAAAIAPLLVAIAVHASLLVWRSYYMNKQPPQVVALDTEILDTRRHQKTLSVQDDYVEWVRGERKLTKLAKDREDLAAKLAPAVTFGGIVSKAVKPLLLLGCVAMWWADPVFCVPAWWLWPATWVLGFPGHEAGCAGILVWTLLVDRVAGVVFGLFGPRKAAPSGIAGLLSKFKLA